MKKCLPAICAAIITIIIVLIPFPKSPVRLRFTVEDYNEKECQLYYTTDGTGFFNQNQIIEAAFDEKKNCITVFFDADVIKEITDMRLDFYPVVQEFRITDITLSSAGVIKKRWDPVDFFTVDNISFTYSIDSINTIGPWNTAIIRTSDEDPYIIFSEELVNRIKHYQSSYRISRLLVCLFLAGCILPVIYRRK